MGAPPVPLCPLLYQVSEVRTYVCVVHVEEGGSLRGVYGLSNFMEDGT